MRRVLFVAIVSLLPLVVFADSATQSTSVTGGSTLQSTGPAVSSSPQTSSLLQPAETSGSSLQSADAGSTGISQSAVENLQQSGSSDQLQLTTEGDGDTPYTLSSSPNLAWLLYVLLVLVVATVGTAVARVWQRRAI